GSPQTPQASSRSTEPGPSLSEPKRSSQEGHGLETLPVMQFQAPGRCPENEVRLMGRYAKQPETTFEHAPAGTHLGICTSVIDLGTQHDEYQGKPITRNRVLIQWEIQDAVRENGEPFVIGKFYTNSLSEKANLRRDLESWRGKAFSEQELNGFDLAKILGAP